MTVKPIIPAAALALALAACGGASSDPSESDAVALIEGSTPARQVHCVKAEGAHRVFACKGIIEPGNKQEGELAFEVIVAESSDAFVVKDCERLHGYGGLIATPGGGLSPPCLLIR